MRRALGGELVEFEGEGQHRSCGQFNCARRELPDGCGIAAPPDEQTGERAGGDAERQIGEQQFAGERPVPLGEYGIWPRGAEENRGKDEFYECVCRPCRGALKCAECSKINQFAPAQRSSLGNHTGMVQNQSLQSDERSLIK